VKFVAKEKNMKTLDRLWVRLTLAFTLVILVTMGAIAVVSTNLTSLAFRQYVTHSDLLLPGGEVELLAQYYEKQGGWQDVDKLLRLGIRVRDQVPGARPAQTLRAFPMDAALLDAQGNVVYVSGRNPGDAARITQSPGIKLSIASADNKQVYGYLLISPPELSLLGPLERAFVTRLRNLLLVGTALAVALSLLAAALLSRTLTAPLQRLAVAARAVAGGDLSQRVTVQGGSAEFVEVAQEFNEMTSALQTATKLRQNLMADVAHELRTPLSVLQGNLRALLDDVYPLEKPEIARLYDETRLLSRLVEDLRELALAEAGQLGLNRRQADLGALFKMTMDNFAPVAEAKALKLNLEIADALPAWPCDPDRIAQVLRNLLSNALRHTPEGGAITLAAEEVGGALRVTVADSGEGIAPDDLAHVFDRFWRADRSRNRESGGSGLGLAIARGLIQAHGGRIWVESALGQGSRFTFELPA
jgi:two-component system OmpR family sensor kinase/two-component system sensor histidine kinase BaeS